MFRDYQVFKLGILEDPHHKEIPQDKKLLLDEIVNQGLVLACRLHFTDDHRKPHEEKPADFYAAYFPDSDVLSLSPKLDVHDTIWYKIPDTKLFEDHIHGPTGVNVRYKGLNVEISNKPDTFLKE
jgi:hypothetical protein